MHVYVVVQFWTSSLDQFGIFLCVDYQSKGKNNTKLYQGKIELQYLRQTGKFHHGDQSLLWSTDL